MTDLEYVEDAKEFLQSAHPGSVYESDPVILSLIASVNELGEKHDALVGICEDMVLDIDYLSRRVEIARAELYLAKRGKL